MERIVQSFFVDYSFSLEEMIDSSSFTSKGESAYCFEAVNYDLFQHQNEKIGTHEWLRGTLFSFYHSSNGRVVPKERIEREMALEGYRPANAAELLSFCEANFYDLPKCNIMATGQCSTVWHKNVFPYLKTVRWPCVNPKRKTIFTSLNLDYKNCFLGVK